MPVMQGALRLHYDCAAMPRLRFENGKQQNQGRNSFALGAHCIGGSLCLSETRRRQAVLAHGSGRYADAAGRLLGALNAQGKRQCVGVRDVRVCVRTGAAATYEESRSAYTLHLCRAVLLERSAAPRRSSHQCTDTTITCADFFFFFSTRRRSTGRVPTSSSRCSRWESARTEWQRLVFNLRTWNGGCPIKEAGNEARSWITVEQWIPDAAEDTGMT